MKQFLYLFGWLATLTLTLVYFDWKWIPFIQCSYITIFQYQPIFQLLVIICTQILFRVYFGFLLFQYFIKVLLLTNPIILLEILCFLVLPMTNNNDYFEILTQLLYIILIGTRLIIDIEFMSILSDVDIKNRKNTCIIEYIHMTEFIEIIINDHCI